MGAMLAEYQARQAARQALAGRLDRLHRATWWGLVAVTVLLGLLLLLASEQLVASAWVLLPLAGLGAVQLAEWRLGRRREQARRAAAFWQDALERLEGRWPPAPFTGLEFVPPDDLSALDLDLVGERSLFTRLDRSRTRIGARTLASWLLHPADAATLALRREAIAELRGRLDLREALALAGPPGVAEVEPAQLAGWARGRGHLPWPWLRWLLGPIAWALLATAAGAALGWWGPWPIAAAAALALAAHAALQGRATATVIEVLEPLLRLSVVAGLMAVIEVEPFRSPLLRALQAELGGGAPASRPVARLARHVQRLLALRLEAVAVIGYPLLWHLREALHVEAWRAAHGVRVEGWLGAVGTFEALCAAAAFADEHPGWGEAELVEDGPVLEAEALGHPLLPKDRCVPNDLRLGGGAPGLLLLSGSNMSGKSTLLRAVGLNVTLAQAGLPVRAARLRLSRLVVGASIRIGDSVLDGESRFYAELRRLRALLARAGEAPVLFLLDELLGGTNSHDRLAGASGVLSGLVRRNAIGLCSTHDLALTRIVDTLGPRAANGHFGDTLEDGRLRFDHRLRPGVVQRSNAIELMRAVGLEV